MTDVRIRLATAGDAAAMARIYNHYVRETAITFEEVPISRDEMASRMQTVDQAELPWLVAALDDAIVGYAYGGKWKPRSAYRFTTETTVYLAPDARRRGVGTRLYADLLARLEVLGLHAAIGGIALPNPASVALHERLGFREVGRLPEVGYKFGRWIDVGYWHRPLASGSRRG